MTSNDGEHAPTPEMSPEEREYVIKYSGLTDPFGGAPGDYAALVAETARRIEATRMSFAEVAALLGVDEQKLRDAAVREDLGLTMHTTQSDLRLTDGGPLTPLEWLAAGGDPQDVWDLLTQDFFG